MTGFVQRHLRALTLAIGFLTTLPVRAARRGDEDLSGLSLLWYPAVGLLLGMVLTLVGYGLPFPVYLQAAVILALWILLTGGLHLDGLADCADAWVGGLGDPEKTLRLLKDPLCGSMAVIALVVLLLLKCAALTALIQSDHLIWLWSVPLLARSSLLLLFTTTVYVRPQGLATTLADQFSPALASRVLVGIAILMLFILPLDIWGALWVALVVVFLLVRGAAISRIGGFTGDVAGAQVELVELGLLLVLSCFVAS